MIPLFVTIPRPRDENCLARRSTCSDVRYFARHVVVINVGASIEDRLDARIIGMEIRDEHFDDNGRIHFLDRSDHSCEMIRTAVFQIVPCDGGNHHML